jgi:hypothetical protein
VPSNPPSLLEAARSQLEARDDQMVMVSLGTKSNRNHGAAKMTTYFVATFSMWTIVDAADEFAEWQAALPGLQKLYAEADFRIGRDFPIGILTVRPATDDEITQWKWHHEMAAKHEAR